MAVENQSNAAVDSFTLKSGYGKTRRDDHFRQIIQLKNRAVPRLQPNSRFQFIDTAVVSAETRSTALSLEVRGAMFSAADSALNVTLAGDTVISVLSSGFELEVIDVPHRTWMQVWGQNSLWAKWWSHTQYIVALRIRNPYEVTLQPFRLTWCEIDDDYCPVHGEVEALTPDVSPGGSRDMLIPFVLSNTATSLFWNFEYASVAICYPQWLKGTCASFNVQVLPVFSAECVVPTILLGETIVDGTPDCDGTGSAYQFIAKAGERYQLSVTQGSAFIVGPEGKDRTDAESTELTVLQDGTYYVIADQRSKRTASFTLNRL